MAEVLDASAAGSMGDPARIHTEGMTARAALEDSRDRIAEWLGVRPRRVVFTSGATESIALVSFSARARGESEGRDHVVTSAVEHSAVLAWADRGPRSVVGVDHFGRVAVHDLLDAVSDRTALVHIQWANHEVATAQRVRSAVAALTDGPGLVHVDAAQAGAEAPVAVASGADAISMSGHKLGAPAGIGLLVLGPNVRLSPLLVGGDQERARRAGIENLAGAAALAAVADELSVLGSDELARSRGLTERMVQWAERRRRRLGAG